ncbi:MAG: sulfurtransferase TusA family protein [Candidatus Aenigmatarchaeota archaeon]|nr:MAG: sulfurtransferase TusA family protein [Candidatus Aenigmarchaeota archaeon]
MRKQKIRIDVRGEKCPVPMVETLKALRNADIGSVIEVIGDHAPSKNEIILATKELGLKLVEVKNSNAWHIIIKKTKAVA